MSGAEAPLAIALFSAAATATTTYVQSEMANEAAAKSRASQEYAASVQEKQLSDAAMVERIKRQRESAQIKARQRVLAAEAGTAPSDYSAFFNQADSDLGFNLGILDQNLRNQTDLVRSGLQANLAELSARYINPVLATVGGGLGGLSTGLQIGRGVEDLTNRTKPKTP